MEQKIAIPKELTGFFRAVQAQCLAAQDAYRRGINDAMLIMVRELGEMAKQEPAAVPQEQQVNGVDQQSV